MNKKEFLIKNPARAVRAQMVQEPYVPEWQRLMAEGKLKGIEAATDLPEHQATLRNQVIKELQLSPKVTVPSVGQQDIGWNKQTKFYDEPLLERPVYDDNFIREDLTSEELEILYEEAAKKQINLDKANTFTKLSDCQINTNVNDINDKKLLIHIICMQNVKYDMIKTDTS
jgi:hypothetical protein